MNLKFFKNLFKKKFICPGAFSQVYIYPDGRVFLCPDCLMSPKAEIGNLNNNSFEEIYNSKQAQKIRKEILKGKYNFCSPVMCFSKSNYNIRLTPFKNLELKAVQSKFPKMVSIGADAECNVNCIMCRPHISRLSNDELIQLKEKVKNLYLPILKDATTLTLSTTADPFASRNTRFLMKEASKQYPNLKFHLLTNGLLCDEFNWIDTGIINRVECVMVSIHASCEEVYNKVVKNGNFKHVEKNIQWLKQQKEQGKIKGLFLAFVVNAKNYEDIPNFIEFAKSNNAVALFWPCIDYGGNLHSDEPLNICHPQNPKHEKLLEVLNSIELETDYSHFSLGIRRLKK
jgi:radical SAM protein with 4Fe4S-binding SPASM domain